VRLRIKLTVGNLLIAERLLASEEGICVIKKHPVIDSITYVNWTRSETQVKYLNLERVKTMNSVK